MTFIDPDDDPKATSRADQADKTVANDDGACVVFSDGWARPDQRGGIADLAATFVSRRQGFDARDDATDAETGAFNDAQAVLIERILDMPACTVDDVIGKLEVVRLELWDRIGGDESLYDNADHLVLSLADDIRRVFGTRSDYRFDPRLWVASAIRAGMEPIAMVEMTDLIERHGRKGHFPVSRQLWQKAADVDERYAPPKPHGVETDAVIDELERLGRFRQYTRTCLAAE